MRAIMLVVVMLSALAAVLAPAPQKFQRVRQ